jgi:hypothetical protein
LDVVERSLEAMKKSVRAKKSVVSVSPEVCRIVTEDYVFAESELGDHIFNEINVFAGWSETDCMSDRLPRDHANSTDWRREFIRERSAAPEDR